LISAGLPPIIDRWKSSIYTRHALERMRKRRVTREQVKWILGDPDWFEDARDNLKLNIKKMV
jgi:hypothetical protein